MVPEEHDHPPLAAERRRRRPQEGSLSGSASPGDEDGGAVRPADAAPAIVLEEADAGGAGGADLAVAARGHRHPLQGFHAHGAVGPGFDVDGIVMAAARVFLGGHGCTYVQHAGRDRSVRSGGRAPRRRIIWRSTIYVVAGSLAEISFGFYTNSLLPCPTRFTTYTYVSESIVCRFVVRTDRFIRTYPRIRKQIDN